MTGTYPTSPIRLATAVDEAVAAHARAVLGSALPPDLSDDRFDSWPWRSEASPSTPPPVFAAALASERGRPTGYLGGPIEAGNARLDALVAAGATDKSSVLDGLYRAILPALEGAGVDVLELWGMPAERWHEQLASARGLVEIRSLHQMRCVLPVEAEAVASRPYRPEDLPGLLAVNNRAFAGHPDQGGLSADDLLATMAQPWFDPDGLRLYERDGRLAGFCWTKIHRRPLPLDDLGEIYVIGVDPDHHGQGLGVPMTAAGLDWLAGRGLRVGMLYVEAGNQPAIRTYERLGFGIVRTDRAWSGALSR